MLSLTLPVLDLASAEGELAVAVVVVRQLVCIVLDGLRRLAQVERKVVHGKDVLCRKESKLLYTLKLVRYIFLTHIASEGKGFANWS